MLAIFLAPVSAGVKINKAEAQTTQTKATVTLKENTINNISASYIITIENTKTGYLDNAIAYDLYIKSWNGDVKPKDAKPIKSGKLAIAENTATQSVSLTLDKLTPNTKYYLMTSLIQGSLSINPVNPTGIPVLDIKESIINNVEFQTSPDNNSRGTTTVNNVNGVNLAGADFGCSILPTFNPGGCLLQVLYVLWQATALVATLGGYFLDFFVYYSTDSASYANTFVSQGWGAVRDIANIFFIIALLYVAIKTILGLNVTDNKKLVGAVIIIGLIINFSLFTTKVVIDSSNILAKVFYNNITSVDTKGATTTGSAGEKSISVGLVDKYDPQTIIMDAYNSGNLGIGYAIFIVLLLMAVTLYTAYIFFSVALLFVARVVSLWISMIFSPIAFASYTVPFSIPGFGHKEWWDELLKNAFLAPIFIFFLYIIVLFTKFLTEIVKYTSDPNLSDITNIMRRLMTMVVPFIILVMLLKMAKDIAVKYSGKMGEVVNKFGAMAGGLALGAATGGAALLGSSTMGKYYQGVANNDELRRKAAGGEGISKEEQAKAQRRLNRANYFAKSSFDVRQTGLGKGFGKISGMDLNKGTGILGISTEKLKGGQRARQEEREKKAQEKMKSYELTKAAAVKQDEMARDKNNPQNIRAAQYEKDKAEAKRLNPSLNEKDFREAYERGANLEEFGIEHKIESGNVNKIKNAKEINQERRTAYADSLQLKADKDTTRGVVRTFWEEFKKGAKNTTKNPIVAGLGVSGIVTGGAGTIVAGATVLGGGFLHAFKEVINTKAPFLGKATRTENAEVIAAIRKGEDPLKKVVADLKKVIGGGEHAIEGEKALHADSKKIEHKEEHQETPKESSHPKEDSGGDDHHHKS